MTAITIAAMASEDGSLTIPRDVVESLGLRPGEEVEISIVAKNGAQMPGVDYNAVLDKLFEEVDVLIPEPGDPPTDPLKAAWGAAVEEKFKKMGIAL